MFLGFPCGSAGKEPFCNVGDLGLIPCLGRSPGEGKGYPLQYSGLENSMNCIVHRVAKSRTQSKDFHSLIHVSKRRYLDFCIPNCRKWKFHLFILHVLYLLFFFIEDSFCKCSFWRKKNHFIQWVEWLSLACVLCHVWLFVTPWTIAHQAPLSMRFPRQEYWNGLPFPSPGDLPNPGIKCTYH